MKAIHDSFKDGIPSHWQVGEIGAGQVRTVDGDLCLSLPPVNSESYQDAQLTDYLPTNPQFQCHPPLKLQITARMDGHSQGTAGFGFWNHPFVPGERGIRIPQAIWFFFGSPQNKMALAQGVAGQGWKAATFNARRLDFFALLPTAPLGFLLMRNQWFYERFWGIGQRAIGVSETALDLSLLADFHRYSIEWDKRGAIFSVDNTIVHQSDDVPQNNLGFIVWIDNQYAIITPQGQFGWGLLDVPQSQSLIIRDIHLENG